jgi:hypothetical protein
MEERPVEGQGTQRKDSCKIKALLKISPHQRHFKHLIVFSENNKDLKA